MQLPQNNLIYLTGFMGSGKSTIAPILANTLGFSFVDIDQEIEKRTGKTVAEIFKDEGEQHFRDIEHSILLDVCRHKNCVISLGGGTIVCDDNLQIIKSSGLLVYLKADEKQIFQRLRFKTDRPLIKSDAGDRLNDEEIYKRIRTLLKEREPFYNQADITITTDFTRVGYTVDEIVREIKSFIK